MPTPDNALAALRTTASEFAAFCSQNGSATEADTRAKIIERILRDVCGWPESGLSRETHLRRDTQTGPEHAFIDYCLKIGSKPTIAVEAKREGAPFVFPIGGRRIYSLDGALLSDQNIKSALYQVRGYCDDGGIRYAIATNGYAWIIFRAVRDDIPWRKGQARVFTGIPDIENNITEFLNLLSYEAISNGSLHDAFSPTTRASREQRRVIDHLHDPDLPIQRNRLNTAIQPLIKLIFEDIADQDQLDVLRACYVHTGSLKRAANDLDKVFSELIPQFLVNAGARPVGLPQSASGFESVLAQTMHITKGELFLLLGGIGSGKSTFLKRYQRTTGAKILAEKTLWFAVDFLQAPLDPLELEPFVWSNVLAAIQARYKDHRYERRRFLNEVFAPQITAIESTILENVKPGSSKHTSVLSPYLHEWQKDLRTYVPALLQASCRRDHRIPVLFIDNVDQLAPPYQAQIFLLAQRVSRLVDAVTIVALREESYYTASVQRSFTAFSSRKFHVASPWFRSLIRSRINYAIRLLSAESDKPTT
jgi:hypothetical protein